MLHLLPAALRIFLTYVLFLESPFQETQSIPSNPRTPQLNFQLRHQHALTNSSRIIFSDVTPSFASESYALEACNIKSYRPPSAAQFHSARLRSIRHLQSESFTWDEVDIPGPNVEQRSTLLTLAKMTNNAYYESPSKEWYGEPAWNSSHPFGWEPDADGLRGHVFVSEDNSTVIISVKGTSQLWIAGGGGPTVKRDKLNDNLLFSCCCARVGPTWSPVCDCYSGGYKCDQTCLENSLVDESLFYSIGINLYNNVTYMYPNANIWLTGHSLGGSLASLIGVTFGVPAVAFEAPGDKLAASRLHLPSPPSLQHVTHVYHTADPIPMGTCTGVTSFCAAGGYALETSCHLGKVVLYDTVTKLGWSVHSSTHSIKLVIDKLLEQDLDWGNTSKSGVSETQKREVPMPAEQKDCVDCYSWTYGDFKG